MAERKRARTKTGAYKAEDPNTPENEAWQDVTPENTATELPPKGSAAYKAMVLRGEIKGD